MDHKKRGQFYLIGAFVIIVIIIGYSVITNYTRILGDTKTYDLADELNIESANVLDYGIYNEHLEVGQMQNLLEGFIEAYSSIGEIEELYFIFGNAENITFMGYQQLNQTVLIDIEIDGEETSPLQVGELTVRTQGYQKESKDIKRVTVIVSGIKYVFKLKEGENFYFILSHMVKGQGRVVVTN